MEAIKVLRIASNWEEKYRRYRELTRELSDMSYELEKYSIGTIPVMLAMRWTYLCEEWDELKKEID